MSPTAAGALISNGAAVSNSAADNGEGAQQGNAGQVRVVHPSGHGAAEHLIHGAGVLRGNTG